MSSKGDNEFNENNNNNVKENNLTMKKPEDNLYKRELTPPPEQAPELDCTQDLITLYQLIGKYKKLSQPYIGKKVEKVFKQNYEDYVYDLPGKMDYTPDEYLQNLWSRGWNKEEQLNLPKLENLDYKTFSLDPGFKAPEEITTMFSDEIKDKGLVILDQSNIPTPKLNIKQNNLEGMEDIEIEIEDKSSNSGDKIYIKRKKKRLEEGEDEGESSSFGFEDGEKKKKKKKKKRPDREDYTDGI
ncbi:hypothetical protein K502DRAFT_366898 [Neoconidiobolus thromboides FSU 785]|nr:hypothetical protein K502DRAFT_366898 [Neoconidiobolus thromboides FSU 785]